MKYIYSYFELTLLTFEEYYILLQPAEIIAEYIDAERMQAYFFQRQKNMLTLAKQQGLDPEQTFGGSTYYRYPAMKTISFGINVKL